MIRKLYIPKLYRKISWHVLFWFLYALFTALYNAESYGWKSIKSTLGFLSLYIPIFYGLLFLISRLLAKRKVLRLFIFMLLLTVPIGVSAYYTVYHLLPKIEIWLFSPSYEVTMLRACNVFAIEYLKLTIWVILAHGVIRTIEFLTEENRKKERDLRWTIDKHFKRNLMTFLASSMVKLELWEMYHVITKLSTVENYSESVSSGYLSMVSLNREVKVMEDMMEMIRMRYKSDKVIDYTRQGRAKQHVIPPLILLTFMENVLKHGDISEEDPIYIKLSIEEEGYHFLIKNRVMNTPVKYADQLVYTGQGLPSVEKRMDLLLKDKYTLDIERNDDYFLLKLGVKNV